MTDLNDLFQVEDKGTQRMLDLLADEDVSEIVANGHKAIFYTNSTGKKMINERLFPGKAQYIAFLNRLISHTDAGWEDVDTAQTAVIEGSLQGNYRGSIHICTSEITRGEPYLTVRKQPMDYISLDAMVDKRLLDRELYDFMVAAVRGRLNILLSGGSGAGKTTFARALSAYIDPMHRVLTCEEIDELHMEERLANVVSLTTYRVSDKLGRTVREVSLEDLVREGLRMRADRIWVGETRGREAYALVKACNSGHDGSLTTIHADDGASAVKQAVTYVMEGGIVEEVARDAVSRAFHLVIQISKTSPTERRITEVTELEPVREGSEQRRNVLWQWDQATDSWVRVGMPSPRLQATLRKHGVNYAPRAF